MKTWFVFIYSLLQIITRKMRIGKIGKYIENNNKEKTSREKRVNMSESILEIVFLRIGKERIVSLRLASTTITRKPIELWT